MLDMEALELLCRLYPRDARVRGGAGDKSRDFSGAGGILKPGCGRVRGRIQVLISARRDVDALEELLADDVQIYGPFFGPFKKKSVSACRGSDPLPSRCLA